MYYFLNALSLLSAYAAMEGVAWLAHKYLMHGPLWFLHKDHHQKESKGFLEKNDWFFVLFATPGILLLFLGLNAGFDFKFFLGLGITFYGFTYFLGHDVFVHRRLPFLRNTQSKYWKLVLLTHRRHHIYKEKHGAEFFGLLWVTQGMYDRSVARRKN